MATIDIAQGPDTAAYRYLPAEAEKRWTGETFTHFLATGALTGGAFCLIDEVARQGESVPLHRHPEDWEAFYVLEGELSLFIASETPTRAVAGSFAYVPGGAVHGFRVESETARYLIITTPQHGEFYRAISLPAKPGGGPPDQAIDWDEIMQTAQDYAIEMIGPLPGDEAGF